MVNTATIRKLMILGPIIVVFITLIVICLIKLPGKGTTELSLEDKWNNYNDYNIINGQKVAIGSDSRKNDNQPTIEPESDDSEPKTDENRSNPAPDNTNGKTKRTFRWNYNGSHFTLDAWLANSLDYTNYGGFSSSEDNYAKFLITKSNDFSIRDVASKLESIARAQGFNSDQLVELTTNFLLDMPYDRYATNAPRFPYQTLMDGQGDCDEKSLLAYKLLAEMGYSVALIYFPPLPGSNFGHMALGVGCSRSMSLYNSGFTCAEVAGPGKLSIGQVTPERVGQAGKIFLPRTGGKKYRSFNV